jgi:hypothetical protein
MSKELTKISTEGLEVANCYLQFGNIRAVSDYLQISDHDVVEYLDRREVKKYIDNVYLDTGYRNKNNIAGLLDEMILTKAEEARESGVMTNKDLAELLNMAHKFRMDEIKAQTDLLKAENATVKNQTNIQVNEGLPFGQGAGNIGKLVQDIVKNGGE